MDAVYTNGRPAARVFDKVYARPVADPGDPSFGLGTSDVIGQDSGNVFALLAVGYNFDGTQSPAVLRRGDPVVPTPVLSVPNFYGAHGYDPELASMSALFMAAGPDIRRGRLTRVRSIDVAPTLARLLGVKPAPVVDGSALPVRIPRAVRKELRDGLRALLPSGDRTTDRRIEAAVWWLGRSLDDDYWRDAAHLDEGDEVFEADRRAVEQLAGIPARPAAITGVIEALAAIDEELVAILIDEALGAAGDPRRIARARLELERAAEELGRGRFAAAIDRYAAGWHETGRARGRSGHGGGDQDRDDRCHVPCSSADGD
jgi:hypothetical protein